MFYIFCKACFCYCRISGCKYNRIGCPWRGPTHESEEHEKECVHPRRSGAEVMETLLIIDQQSLEERRLFDRIFDLLDYEKITFNGNFFAVFIILGFNLCIGVFVRLTAEAVSY